MDERTTCGKARDATGKASGPTHPRLPLQAIIGADPILKARGLHYRWRIMNVPADDGVVTVGPDMTRNTRRTV